LGSNPGGDEFSRVLLHRPRGPPSLLCTGYRVSFPEVKRPGRGVDHPPTSSAEIKERVELYLYLLQFLSIRNFWVWLGEYCTVLFMILVPLYSEVKNPSKCRGSLAHRHTFTSQRTRFFYASSLGYTDSQISYTNFGSNIVISWALRTVF